MKSYCALFCCLLLSIGTIVQANSVGEDQPQDKDNHDNNHFIATARPEDHQPPEEASPNFAESGYRSQNGRSLIRLEGLKEYCQKIRDLKNSGVPITLPAVCLLVPTIRPPPTRLPWTTTTTSTYTSSPTSPPLPTPCSSSSKFVEADFKSDGGTSTRFVASSLSIASNCHPTPGSNLACKCNVKNLVQMGDSVFPDYDKACQCSSTCKAGDCAFYLDLLSDDADMPDAKPDPMPKLARKFATCDCQEDSAVASSSFTCTCT